MPNPQKAYIKGTDRTKDKAQNDCKKFVSSFVNTNSDEVTKKFEF